MIFVVVPTYNNIGPLVSCLDSIKNQDHSDFTVCVVDDNSHSVQKQFIKNYCKANSNFSCIQNTERKGSLYNQWQAINSVTLKDTDIIAIVDGDDVLARSDAFSIVQSYYDDGYWLTYGNYRNISGDSSPQAVDYSESVKLKNRYRRCGELLFNHLRTFSYRLYKNIDPDKEFKFADGEWFMTCADTAIMIPCLELAGGNYKFIEEVLYIYNSDNPNSDWKLNSLEIDRTHSYILNNLKRKKPLNGIQVR